MNNGICKRFEGNMLPIESYNSFGQKVPITRTVHFPSFKCEISASITVLMFCRERQKGLNLEHDIEFNHSTNFKDTCL